MPRAQTANPEGEQYFSRDRFTYDSQGDSDLCPAGETLGLGRVSCTEKKKEYWNGKACQGCSLKPQCTRAAKRTIVRSFYQKARGDMHLRATSAPKWTRQRESLVEHPFGTMKWLMGTHACRSAD